MELATIYVKPSHEHIMGICETMNKTTRDIKSISKYIWTIQSLGTLAFVDEPLGKDEITYHVLNDLAFKYKEISAAIGACNISISFA